MATSHLANPRVGDTAIAKMFDEKPPVLVEVRFPGMATSPDWYLCKDRADLAAILDRLGPGAEIHLSSVWDLKNTEGALVLGNQVSPK